MNSDILNEYDEKRVEFRPYGLTCEMWIPKVMRKPDRHNEIEINYLTKGNISYLFQGTKITVPAQSLTLFWGLIPHQIIDYTGSATYYVCTIPLTQFLDWKLPSLFVERVLQCEVIIEKPGEHSFYDEFLFKNWLKDLAANDNHDEALNEMHARLLRMASRSKVGKPHERSQIQPYKMRKVEQIARFLSQNYHNPIRSLDIGTAVCLHPDYANVIFRKAFGITIKNYIIQERISHAQRKLILTDNSITDISFECGFNSISRFNNAFRKINNCTPREFRKGIQ